MSLVELGAIGELVGGFAVLVTLIYLGIQVRQSNRMAVVAGYQRGQDELQRYMQFMAANPDLVDIYTRGTSDYRSLSAVEQVRFHLAVGSHLALYHSAWKAYRDGAIDKEMYEGYEEQVLSVIREPGGREWWQEVRQVVTPQLKDRIDDLLQRTEFRIPLHSQAFEGFGGDSDKPSS